MDAVDIWDISYLGDSSCNVRGLPKVAGAFIEPSNSRM